MLGLWYIFFALGTKWIVLQSLFHFWQKKYNMPSPRLFQNWVEIFSKLKLLFNKTNLMTIQLVPYRCTVDIRVNQEAPTAGGGGLKALAAQ